MESNNQYPANIYYDHNRATSHEDTATTKPKDYVLTGMILCLVVFLGTALLMTILSMTLLYRWIPEILLIILTVAGPMAAGFLTLKHFLDRDAKQWGNR